MSGEPTSFGGQTPDRVRQPDNPYIGYDLIKGTYENEELLGDNGAVGFTSVFSVSLSALNLDLIIPDIEVMMRTDVNLGGGIYQRTWKRLPFVTIDTNGEISERAEFNVTFQYELVKGYAPITGTTFLGIAYYNRNTDASGQVFNYKIKSSRAQTISGEGIGE